MPRPLTALSTCLRGYLAACLAAFLAMPAGRSAHADEPPPGAVALGGGPTVVCSAKDAAVTALVRTLRRDAAQRVDIDVFAGPAGSIEVNLARAADLADALESALYADGIRGARVTIRIQPELVLAPPRELDHAASESSESSEPSEPSESSEPADRPPPAARPEHCTAAWAELRLPDA